MQILAVSFIVGENEGPFFLDRPSHRAPELVALKGRSRTLVEEIWGIERVVAQEFERGPVPLIAS